MFSYRAQFEGIIMEWLDTILSGQFSTPLDTLTTSLIVAVAAGLIWGASRYVSQFITHYFPTWSGIGEVLFQGLIFAGGFSLVSQLVGFGAATILLVITAIIWCGTVVRETYLLTVDNVVEDGAIDLLPTQVEPTSQVERPSVPITYSSERVEQPVVPTRRLTRRSTLGKQTIRSF